MGRFTAFRFTIDASAAQSVMLARHAGAARFGFNQCLAIVKQALDARRVDGSVMVPWSGFDLINAFNQWKRGEDAGRVIVVDPSGSASVEVTGLRWRTEVCAQVFEEAAVDLGRALGGDGGEGWVGVDRGLTAFVVAATTTGREVLRITPPRPLRCGRARLRHLSRAVTRKRKGSTNRARATARLGRAHARIRNIRHEFLHEVANRLVQTHDRLAFEDLHITAMVANHRLAAAISDASWGHLYRIVRYKQAWRHGHLTLVDRFYPSTKTCHHCRQVATGMSLSTRIFDCATCGCRVDRDLNAAINLAIWAERQHVQVRDPDARGPVINASRGDGSGPRDRVGETSLDDGGTPPTPHSEVGTPENGGVT